MTPRYLNMWMMIIFISRVSERWKQGEERGDESVWDVLNLKCLWDIKWKLLSRLKDLK